MKMNKQNIKIKKAYFIILSIIIIVCLVSLAFLLINRDKSEELMNQDNDKKNQENETTLDYDTVDHIFSNLSETLSKDYSNIKVKSSLKINKPEQIGVLQFTQTGDFLSHSKDVLDYFIPKDTFIKKYYTTNPKTYPPGPEYHNKKTEEYLGLDNTGFITYGVNDDYRSDILVKSISVTGEYENKSYKCKDGEMKISEAVSLAENDFKDYIKASGSFLQAFAKGVDVYQLKNDFYYFVVIFDKGYKGVNFLSTGRSSRSLLPLETVYTPCQTSQITIFSKEKKYNIADTIGVLNYEKTIESYDKIITLESALNQAKTALNGYFLDKVKSISLSYRMIQSTDETEDSSTDLLWKGDTGTVSTASPCWVFFFQTKANQEELALVDCKTGKVDMIKN